VSIRDSGDVDPAQAQRACQQIALVQYMDVLLDHGEEIARNSLKQNPAKLITLINSICNMSNTSIALEKHQLHNLPDASIGTSNKAQEAQPPAPVRAQSDSKNFISSP
jgi:hypothetical protein